MDYDRFVKKKVTVSTIGLLTIQSLLAKLLEGKETEIEQEVRELVVDGTQLATLLQFVDEVERHAQLPSDNGSKD